MDLEYYPDTRPGIARRRQGRGFTYLAPDGTTIARGAERTRLEALAVPPAYERVWMSPLGNGHLQATGYDVRARKQYRYHPDWAAARAGEKFGGLAAFGRALPAIRRRVARDLERDDERAFALAAAVALIDRLSLRVGHEDYVQENGSYGALTLRRRHVRLQPGEVRLDYVAKGGREVSRRLRDRTLSRVLERARDLPGATLLSWTDGDGAAHAVSSHALNAYIADAGGVEETAKTFRTWAGTLAAFAVAMEDRDVTIKAMAEAAADRLANTATIARNSYIHPKVIALAERTGRPRAEVRMPGLRSGEGRLIAFLER